MWLEIIYFLLRGGPAPTEEAQDSLKRSHHEEAGGRGGFQGKN